MNKLLQFLASIGFAIFNAFVLTKLWAWFVVPALGVDPISMPIAFGLFVTAVMFTRTRYKSTFENYTEEFTFRLLKPSIVLLAGWVATLFL